MSELPGSMVQLDKLEELCLTSNFFATFPEFAMKMSGLKKVHYRSSERVKGLAVVHGLPVSRVRETADSKK